MISLKRILLFTALLAAANPITIIARASEYQIVGDCGGFP